MQTAYFYSSYSMANIRCGCWSVASLKFHYKPHLLICGFIKLLSSKMTNSKNCGIHAVLAFYRWIHAALQKFESENTEEWCIPFWNVYFCFRDIDSFVLCKLGKLFCHMNNEYKYWSTVLQTWHQKCTSQKKPNDTHIVIAMETLLASVPFCQKPNILIFNPQSRTEGPAWNRHGYYKIVVTPIVSWLE